MPGRPPDPADAAANEARLAALQAAGINVQATRHARRVYVGGFPDNANEPELASFMSNALVAVGGASGAYDPENGMTCVLSVYINREKQFAFIEFRTVEEASNAMALDGVVMGGSQLRVRRPNDYNPQQAALIGPTTPSDALNLAAVGLVAGPNGVPVVGAAPGMVPGIPSTQQSSGRKLYVGNLPPYLTELQVLELVQSFGKVQAFNLVVDKDTGALKGYGFFEYADAAAEEPAMEGLTGMRLGDKVLNVKRAAYDPGGGSVAGGSAPPGFAPGSFPANGESASECVRLANMVTREELTDPTEAREILEDTQEECAGFGKLERVVMPLPRQTRLEDPAGVGEVFLLFADTEGAARAVRSLNGRKFADRVVSAGFITRAEFDKHVV